MSVTTSEFIQPRRRRNLRSFLGVQTLPVSRRGRQTANVNISISIYFVSLGWCLRGVLGARSSSGAVACLWASFPLLLEADRLGTLLAPSALLVSAWVCPGACLDGDPLGGLPAASGPHEAPLKPLLSDAL